MVSWAPVVAPFLRSRRMTFPCLPTNSFRNGTNPSLSCAIASASCPKSTQATAARPHRSTRCSTCPRSVPGHRVRAILEKDPDDFHISASGRQRLLCAETSSPCSRSMRTTSAWPRNDAGCNGVDPSDSRPLPGRSCWRCAREACPQVLDVLFVKPNVIESI